MRFGSADDMWLMGVNCCSCAGYSIGTPGLGMCSDIFTIGNVTARYELRTPLVHTDKIQGNGAAQVTIDDNVIIPCNLITTGIITASNSNPYWVAMKISASGGVLTNTGRYTATVVKAATDSSFDFTFREHPRGVNAIIITQAFEFSSCLRNQTSTTVRVMIRNNLNGSAVSSVGEFNILVLA